MNFTKRRRDNILNEFVKGKTLNEITWDIAETEGDVEHCRKMVNQVIREALIKGVKIKYDNEVIEKVEMK